jgi:hypothetical protein
MVSSMKRLAYFLILLLITDQVDDAWAFAPAWATTPVAADDDYDDDYLPVQRQSARELSPCGHGPAFLGRDRQAAELTSCRRGVPSRSGLTGPFAPPALYVLVSLQI